MMLHPSYSDLMKVVNSEVEEGETPVVNSRYSIVMATSKRARQIIARQSAAGEDMKEFAVSKPLSKAVEELYSGQLKILPGEQEDPEEKAKTEAVKITEMAETAETAEASATVETTAETAEASATVETTAETAAESAAETRF